MTKAKFFALFVGTRFSIEQGSDPPLLGQITARKGGKVMIQWNDGSQILVTADDPGIMDVVGKATLTK